MRRALFLIIAVFIVSASPVAAAPGFDAGASGMGALPAGSWFLSLSPGARDQLRFFAIDAADASHLYLRRFATPSFYLDALSGNELKIFLWPEAKKLSLTFTPDESSFTREASPIKVEYRRTTAAPAGRSAPYVGDWEIGAQAMTVSMRACEKRDWTLVMYFPGDPLSAIPLGYYPLSPTGDGGYRSSSAFSDSQIELEYDPASDALVIRPLFKERPLAAELYDPVRAWRGK
jgi:hypothetical protein